VVAASPGQSFLAQRTEARQWQRLSEPIQLLDVDWRRHPDAAVRSTVSGTATSSGLITGLTIFFELHVSPSVRLCTDPSTAAEHSNWRNPVAILPVAL
jgi:hypothetical protein